MKKIAGKSAFFSKLKNTSSYPKFSPLERSEKGTILPRRDSGSGNREAQYGC
ncbi:hypothetical protein [Methanosarcina sp. UBA289]|uniref:hypothetical protein n=1 Tax=Methanosarcina sp. UBA289 TaxID=1915574 RepID=UPI0025F510EC|nr:hypothetical protein [Methanosarcina sp. UBA289]